MKLVSGVGICLIFVALIFSCTRDMVTEVENECAEPITYDDHIRSIMDQNCAYTGCHSGGGAPGNFTSYNGVSDYIDGGLIERRVTVDRNMPPNNATQGPTELSEEEIDLFNCWIEAGYPEK